MNDILREITHDNVERLLQAIYNERDARVELQEKVKELQANVIRLTTELNAVKARSNAAFALAQGGSSTS